jgi:hypothetical protein
MRITTPGKNKLKFLLISDFKRVKFLRQSEGRTKYIFDQEFKIIWAFIMQSNSIRKKINYSAESDLYF